jgi:hypothetical protein
MVSFSDSILSLSIRLQGFDFFSEGFLSPRKLQHTISLRKIRIHTMNGEVSGYLPTYEIGRELAARMNFPSEVYTVYPDTLFFDLQRVTPTKIQRIVSMPAAVVPSKTDSLKLHKIK